MNFIRLGPSLDQFERRVIQERTQSGLTAVKARGRKGGRPKIFTNDPKVQVARNMSKNLSIRIGEILRPDNFTGDVVPASEDREM